MHGMQSIFAFIVINYIPALPCVHDDINLQFSHFLISILYSNDDAGPANAGPFCQGLLVLHDLLIPHRGKHYLQYFNNERPR